MTQKLITFICFYCKEKKYQDHDVFNYATYPNKKTLFTSNDYICNNCQVIEKKYIDHLQNEIKRILKEDKVNISIAKKAQKYYKKFTSDSLELLKKECFETAADTKKTYDDKITLEKKHDPRTCFSCGTIQNRHKDNCSFLNNEIKEHCLKIGYITEDKPYLHLTKIGYDYIDKIQSLSKEERNKFNGIQRSKLIYLYLLNGYDSA